MLALLDWALFGFHALWTFFNVVGWAWRRTRVLHLITLSLTALSWFVLGAFYGWGYCICTDWDAQIQRRLGREVTDATWLQSFVWRLFRLDLDRALADYVTVGVFGLIIVATVVVWVRDLTRRRARGDGGV